MPKFLYYWFNYYCSYYLHKIKLFCIIIIIIIIIITLTTINKDVCM
jgi:hypothetical protein